MGKIEEAELQTKVDILVAKYRAWPIISEARELLRKRLPPIFCYHSPAHTDDVFNEALLFGLQDKLSERRLDLLAVAAAYHDVGFTESPVEHESRGALLVDAAMQKHGGYTQDEANLIRQMILDTKLVRSEKGVSQVANTELSCYLLDADLSNLGREDFFEKLELVRKELGVDKQGFIAGTLGLITRHVWHTPAATALRLEREMINIRMLKDMIVTN